MQNLHISEGCLAAEAVPGARRFDASGLIVAPGIVDLHGDGFERCLSPRPKVHFPPEIALIDADRQLIANGITTAFLAMTVSWEPGLRSLAAARAMVAALQALRPKLICDIRLQLRWEIYALDAAEQIEAWLDLDPAPVLAFNDHFTGLYQAKNRTALDVGKSAARAGLTVEEYWALAEKVGERRAEVAPTVARLAAAAAAKGVTCFAHDENDRDVRLENRGLGISVSEFPLTECAAREAMAHGEPIVLGAPNVVRGGSHIGALDAEPAAKAGLCTALASDYYYPAPLAAAARMGADRAEVWSLVSGGAAKAAGLADRGGLAPGMRGDLALFSHDGGRAVVEAVFVGGKPVLVKEFDRVS